LTVEVEKIELLVVAVVELVLVVPPVTVIVTIGEVASFPCMSLTCRYAE
jgi:hypothetical protein